MVNVTETAKAQLDKYFEENEVQPIRIFLGGSCCGPALAMALDDPQADDEKFEVDGLTFVVDKALFEAAGDMTVDMGYQGFAITSVNDVTAGASSSCCSSGSCGSGGGSCCG